MSDNVLTGSTQQLRGTDFEAGPAAHEDLLGVLDIGTSKVTCLIYAVAREKARGARSDDVPEARFLGVGVCKAVGVKAGVVIDLDAAERCVRVAVEQAERMAQVTLESVYVSVSCGRLASEIFVARADVEKARVSESDIAKVFAAGRSHAEREGRRLLELDALGYRLDGDDGIEDPRGMNGRELGIDLHAVTADEPPLRNLRVLVERCFLSVAGLIVAPHASGMVATTPDERTLGVTCVDIGAGTTTVSMFVEGHFVRADALAIGGNHITFDIARALSTPVNEAERIKTLNGGLVEAASDAHEMISYPSLGEEVMLHQINRAQLIDLIRPRYEQILKMVGERLASNGLGSVAGGRLVLTGGASQIAGLETFARDFMRRPVRIGTPSGAFEVPARLANGNMSTALGMMKLVSAVAAPGDIRAAALEPDGTYLKRVGQWFRESF